MRNRIRRRLREGYRSLMPQLKSGYDVVVVARSRAVEVDYHKLRRDLAAAMEALGLLDRREA